MEHDSKKAVISPSGRDTQEASQTFYDAAWDKWDNMIRYSPAPRIRRDKLISWISKIAPKSLLDVGCGNGEFLLQVHKVIPKIQLTGADVAVELVSSNRLRMPEFIFENLNINKDILPERYDAVVCMEVIEHCADYQEVIARLARMTNQWLLLTVPCGPLFEIDRRVGHMKHFKPKDIEEALANVGLHVIKLQQWGLPFFNIYKHVINVWPDKMCESFLSEQKYGLKQKMLSYATYMAFKLCLPKWGYQMFVMAGR